MKVLIHDHPQLTYFSRIYKELHENKPTYYLLDGPSWMEPITKHMHDFLKATRLLSKISANIVYLSHNDSDFQANIATSRVAEIIELMQTKPIIDKLIENSCVDTLCRNLDSDSESIAYFEGSLLQRQSLIAQKKRQFLGYTHKYLNIIKSINPDIIYISHGVYNCYTSLYLAAHLSGIDVRIYHGGYATRYYSKSISSNLNPRYAVNILFNKLVPINMPLKNKISALEDFRAISVLGDTHKNSLIPALLRTSYPNHPNHRVLIITLPIFSEVNRVFDDTNNSSLFDNKWDYIKFIVDSYIPSMTNRLILHLHPHQNSKEDSEIVRRLLFILKDQITDKQIVISNDVHQLEELSRSKIIGFQISKNLDILSEGSTPLELAQAGYQCNCTNLNLAPYGSYTKINTLQELSELINHQKRFPRRISDPQYILKSKSLGRFYGKTSKLTPTSDLLHNIDDFYHFGKITRDPNPDIFNHVFHEYINSHHIQYTEYEQWCVQKDVMN